MHALDAFQSAGARQLLWGDVHSAASNFKPLYDFLAREIVLPPQRPIATLPTQSWLGLLSVVAAFLPFYYPAEARPETDLNTASDSPSPYLPLMPQAHCSTVACTMPDYSGCCCIFTVLLDNHWQ